MRSKKKKILTLDQLLEKVPPVFDRRDIYKNKYKRILDDAKAPRSEEDTLYALKIKTGKYSLRTRVKNNPWVNHLPASKAIKWLFTEVFKNASVYKYSKMIMYQGGMFIFEYKNPKYKGTSSLPWFDKFPLIISLGPIVTKLGVRNLGFNLHLLPPKIRIIVMCSIFELHKKMYRYQIFLKMNRPVTIHYTRIVHNLRRFGVKFCVRMYIPSRTRQVVRFPYSDWHKAIFIPSRGYDSIRAQNLIKEWRNFCKKEGFSINPNIDWKSHI